MAAMFFLFSHVFLIRISMCPPPSPPHPPFDPSASYGLPPEFTVKAMKYDKGSVKRLRTSLEQLFGHLDKADGSKAEVGVEVWSGEKMGPGGDQAAPCSTPTLAQTSCFSCLPPPTRFSPHPSPLNRRLTFPAS